MSKVLAEWGNCWSDEIEVGGFCIIDEKKLAKQKQKLLDINEPFAISIGTNQEIVYRNGQQMLNDMSEKQLSEIEAEVFTKYFGKSYGLFPCFDFPFRKPYNPYERNI